MLLMLSMLSTLLMAWMLLVVCAVMDITARRRDKTERPEWRWRPWQTVMKLKRVRERPKVPQSKGDDGITGLEQQEVLPILVW